MTFKFMKFMLPRNFVQSLQCQPFDSWDTNFLPIHHTPSPLTISSSFNQTLYQTSTPSPIFVHYMDRNVCKKLLHKRVKKSSEIIAKGVTENRWISIYDSTQFSNWFDSIGFWFELDSIWKSINCSEGATETCARV